MITNRIYKPGTAKSIGKFPIFQAISNFNVCINLVQLYCKDDGYYSTRIFL